jgi:hypothetical protein
MLLSFVFLIFGYTGSAFGPQRHFGFMTSYVIYVLSRFLMACGTRGINETGYVLALELVGSELRSRCAIGFEFFFSFGQLILVFLAYFIRDWRQMTMVMAVAVIPFVGYFLYVSSVHFFSK